MIYRLIVLALLNDEQVFAIFNRLPIFNQYRLDHAILIGFNFIYNSLEMETIVLKFVKNAGSAGFLAFRSSGLPCLLRRVNQIDPELRFLKHIHPGQKVKLYSPTIICHSSFPISLLFISLANAYIFNHVR